MARPLAAARPLPALAIGFVAATAGAQQPDFRLTDAEYFDARGASVLVFSNWYSGMFSDSKLSGVEVIQHGVRIATNGDVRLSNTPEQWDPIPVMAERRVDRGADRIVTSLSYPDYQFTYHVAVQAEAAGVVVSVNLDHAVPAALEGLAGFNLEFLPSAYFRRMYLMDGNGGGFPRHPTGPMVRAAGGALEAAPLATGNTLVLAPEDPVHRVTIISRHGSLSLYDGRNRAQNGWFVVRGLLPAGATGTVLEWSITPNRIGGWLRTPVIGHSQVGYHPDQAKIAVLENDPNDERPSTVRLLRIGANGEMTDRLARPAVRWGPYFRYQYATFDFSEVTEPGLYALEFRGVRTQPFRIAPDVYDGITWQSTLDTYLAVQMDHMFVTDRYRVWHGASHLDDAKQAPVDHPHFDGYRQTPATDSPYQPGEHIPGLDVGGWYDAGDFDIRTPSVYGVVTTLVHAYEAFGIEWDETTVRQSDRYVAIGEPDGVPDILQQIEHGARALLAQFRAVGHAIPGIIAPTLDQYTHLGDGASKTDNRAGTADDRWAFTNRSTGLNYGAAAALAAASRALRGYRDSLAAECLVTARRVWEDEHGREPIDFQATNTTGGPIPAEETRAAVELLLATKGGDPYRRRLEELWPVIEASFGFLGATVVPALPYASPAFRSRMRQAVARYRTSLEEQAAENPFGVPIARGGWGGSGGALGFAMRNYLFHTAFPDLIGPEHTVRGLGYVLGVHPTSSVSLVSGVGTHSMINGYGNNRADFSFIPGGVVPGILIVRPDFPELMEDWPFLWYENEYTIGVAATYIYVANAVRKLFERT
jgi:hypothetical protein